MRILLILTQANEKVLVIHHGRQFLGRCPRLHVRLIAPVAVESFNYLAATTVSLEIPVVVARRFHALSPTNLLEVQGTRIALEIGNLETPSFDY